MGRRELLIALGFVAAGVVAYQLTAPASPARRFSFGEAVAEFRREVRGNPGRGSVTHTGTIPALRAMTEVRLAAVGTLSLVGEDRADVAYELTVHSSGPDDAAAVAAAEGTTVSHDTFGHVLALRVVHPPQARSTSALSVRVPTRFAVRIEGIRRATIGRVAAVHLENVIGDLQLTRIAGTVSGTHRNGSLAVVGAGAVDVTVNGSRLSVSDAFGDVTIAGRGGEVEIVEPAGVVDATVADLNLEIVRPRDRVRVSGSNGQITVDRPRGAIDIEGRRAEITITIDAAVPVTASTTERTLRLLLDPAAAVTIDARTTGDGAIDASAMHWTAEPADRGQRLVARAGGDTRVALRAERGAIVIAQAK